MPFEPPNPLDALLGYQLRRASAALMADLARALAGLRLTTTQASILVLIDARPGITQSEVGRLLGIQRANIAPLIASLDRAGLIERTRVDGRSQGLRVAATGTTTAHDALAAMQAHDARVMSKLPRAFRTRLQEELTACWDGPPES